MNVASAIKNFLVNYAEVHGLPSSVRNVNRITQSIIFLPAEMSYKSVHRDFLAGLKEDSRLHGLKYDSFRKLWYQLTSYIQIMSPRSDLCDTCQQLWNDLQFKACNEEEARDLLKKYKEHLAKAKLERNYYNKNTKLAKEHRKLMDQNYSAIEDRIPYCSTMQSPITGMIVVRISMYHTQINRLERFITLVLATYTCLGFKMKQSESRLIMFLMRISYLEKVQMAHLA
jgi:hypothetical protein